MSTDDLSRFIEDVTGESYLRVQENLGDGFVRLRAREAQRRQAKQDITCFEDVVLELLRNSRDAGARAIFIASWKEQGRRFLTVLDDGAGIPEHLHETIFEPFVTSKLDTFHEDRWGVHGRGMALYSIKENVENASVLYSMPDAGTALSVDALTSVLSERIDQSTLPYIHINNAGEQIMRGPRNIARIVMEFALDSTGQVDLYFGSPVEIASSLAYYRTSDGPGKGTGEFFSSENETVLDHLKYIYDPDTFSERAGEIGLPLSSRSARRILDGQIAPLAPFIERLGFEGHGKEASSSKDLTGDPDETGATERLYHEQRKLRIAESDLAALRSAVETAFEDLARDYYLEQADELKVRAGSDKITITIPFRIQR